MKKILAILTCALLLAASACGSSSGKSGGGKTLTVLAAASLTGTFGDLKTTFEKQHPGVKVKLVFDSSATLAQMAEQGAPGDVLATADKQTMDDADGKGGVSGSPTEFATNVIQLAVPATNPAHITSFSQLQSSKIKYVVCVKTAPCGAAGDALLKANGITHKPVSEEVDVKSVLAKVSTDNADAGLVYRTDVEAAGKSVKGLTVPKAAANPNTYWVAVTKNAKQSGLAKDWISLMTGSTGQKVLTDAGFGKP